MQPSEKRIADKSQAFMRHRCETEQKLYRQEKQLMSCALRSMSGLAYAVLLRYVDTLYLEYLVQCTCTPIHQYKYRCR